MSTRSSRATAAEGLFGLGYGRVSKRKRWNCEALPRNEIRTRAGPFGARRELSEGAIELGGVPTLPAAVFLFSSSGTRAARNGLPLDHAPRRLAGVTPPSPFRLSIGGGSPTLNISEPSLPAPISDPVDEHLDKALASLKDLSVRELDATSDALELRKDGLGKFASTCPQVAHAREGGWGRL